MPTTARGETIEQAASKLVQKLVPGQFALGNMDPHDTEAYFEGDEEGTYTLEYQNLDKGTRESVVVEAEDVNGDWKLTTK